MTLLHMPVWDGSTFMHQRCSAAMSVRPSRIFSRLPSSIPGTMRILCGLLSLIARVETPETPRRRYARLSNSIRVAPSRKRRRQARSDRPPQSRHKKGAPESVNSCGRRKRVAGPRGLGENLVWTPRYCCGSGVPPEGGGGGGALSPPLRHCFIRSCCSARILSKFFCCSSFNTPLI